MYKNHWLKQIWAAEFIYLGGSRKFGHKKNRSHFHMFFQF
jgi:hypothetical protein